MNIKSFFGGYELIYDNYDGYIVPDNFYIVSSTVKKFYDIKPVRAVYVDRPEDHKEYVAVAGIIEQLLNMGMSRKDMLVGVGGGAVQDITGFIASVLFRGVPYELIPTTLMSQADSCIGSKTSINFKMIKNQVGTFYPPKRIIVDKRFLHTLPEEEMVSGMGEIVKCHILDGRTKLVSDDIHVLIDYALNVKKGYVEQDEFDRGVRHYLNYGHTFGHAIEGASGHSIVHGLGVILGIDISNYIAFKMGRIGRFNYDRVRNFLDGYRPSIPMVHDLLFYLKLDKKNMSKDKLNLVIMNDSLKPEEVQVPYQLVMKYFYEYQKREMCK